MNILTVQQNDVKIELIPTSNPPIIRGAFYQHSDGKVYIMAQVDPNGRVCLINLDEGNRFSDISSENDSPFVTPGKALFWTLNWTLLPPGTKITLTSGKVGHHDVS